MERLILVLNCGSSSLKFGLYRRGEDGPLLVREGEAEEIGGKNSSIPDHAAALAHALAIVTEPDDVSAVGHRIVHGGPDVRAHQLLTPSVMESLRAAIPFAPLHLPAALSTIDATRRTLPKARQVICLDTAFHHGMPKVAKTLALPASVRGLGVERFGFHGLSLESIVAPDGSHARTPCGSAPRQWSEHHGDPEWSIDRHQHGLDAVGGIMMGTRSGDIDPGTIVYLMRKGYVDVNKLESRH